MRGRIQGNEGTGDTMTDREYIRILETQNKLMIELLSDALMALLDLGACDDPECDEPNCLHVASRIQKLLEQPKIEQKKVLPNPLPCPFCGSENLRIEEYGIECRNCGIWMDG